MRIPWASFHLLAHLPWLESSQSLRAGRPQAPSYGCWRLSALRPRMISATSGAQLRHAVRDQGSCGSCVAFGTCAVLESTLRVATNNPALDVDLSEAHLFYCYARHRAAGARTDGGLKRHWMPVGQGLAFEQSYPYTPGDQNCTGLNPTGGRDTSRYRATDTVRRGDQGLDRYPRCGDRMLRGLQRLLRVQDRGVSSRDRCAARRSLRGDHWLRRRTELLDLQEQLGSGLGRGWILPHRIR